MALSTTARKVVHDGNGVATVFAFTFPIPEASQLSVVYTDADGDETTIASTSYSVTGIGTTGGGAVTYPLSGSPIAAGTSLTIARTVALTQPTVLTNQGGYYPEVVERRLDEIMMAIQQVNERIDRSIRGPISAAAYSDLSGDLASKVVGFDAQSLPVVLNVSGSVIDDAALVEYQPTWTGSIARSTRRRLMDRAYMTDFGAEGDGGTDDWEAFQKAADWATSADGRTLMVPDPEVAYRITTGPVDFFSGTYDVTIQGESPGTTEIEFNFARTLTNYAGFKFGDRSGIVRNKSFELRNLFFSHVDATGIATPRFIDCYGGGQAKMQGMKFGGGTGSAVRLTSVQNFRGSEWKLFGPHGKAYPYRDLTGFTFTVTTGGDITASAACMADPAWVGRRFVVEGANGIRYHMEIATVTSTTTGTVTVATRPPSQLTSRPAAIESAFLSMTSGSPLATLDSVATVTSAADVGQRIWIIADDTGRMRPCTIMANPGANQWTLDYTPTTGNITLQRFGVPIIEIDEDPGSLPGSAKSVDVKIDGLLVKEAIGIAVAAKGMSQADLTSVKIENTNDPLTDGDGLNVGSFWLDNVDGRLNGDLSGPHYHKSRIQVRSQTSTLLVQYLISRIGYFEREFELGTFSDAAGRVLVGHVDSLGRDAPGTPLFTDANSPSKFKQFGAFNDGTVGYADRFYLGDADYYVEDASLLHAKVLNPLKVIEEYTAPAITAGVLTIDLTLGSVFNVSNNANITTFTISNPTAAKAASFTLILTANGTGYTQAWGASVLWPGGTDPTLVTTNARKAILAFTTNDGGTTWYGLEAGQDFS